MLSENLSAIEGVSIYPIISMIVFLAVFIVVVVWVIKLDKKYVNRMENIPLDFNYENENNSEIKNEIKE